MELKKIMLIDDSEAENFLNSLLIREHLPDCELIDAGDGKKALHLIAESATCPDVVFLDINMPVMDGIEFLSKYSTQAKCMHSTRVYMLTSSEREEDKLASLSFPFVSDYITKPLTPDHLQAILS